MFRFFVAIGLIAAVSSASLPGRIVGGSDATNENLPWMVSIVNYGSHHCGAAIINKKTVVTGAHCLMFLNKRLVKVRAGSKFASRGGVLVPVEDFIMHPKFDFPTMDKDIGLVRLKEELVLSKTIEPIPLPKFGYTVEGGKTAVVSGWGFITDVGPYSEILQFLAVDTIDYNVCKSIFRKRLSDNMICAGRLGGGHDACTMDSGGPLVADNLLIGLVSWGVGCASQKYPGVYTNVAAFRPWVDGELATYGETLN